MYVCSSCGFWTLPSKRCIWIMYFSFVGTFVTHIIFLTPALQDSVQKSQWRNDWRVKEGHYVWKKSSVEACAYAEAITCGTTTHCWQCANLWHSKVHNYCEDQIVGILGMALTYLIYMRMHTKALQLLYGAYMLRFVGLHFCKFWSHLRNYFSKRFEILPINPSKA